MNNRLICVEGAVDFDEEISNNAINVVSFREGQKITINRERLPEGRSFSQHMTLQINQAENLFNNFTLIKIEPIVSDIFVETIEVIFSFVSGSGQRVWQATIACFINEQYVINFSSLYPDEMSMNREVSRLKHCATSFVLN